MYPYILCFIITGAISALNEYLISRKKQYRFLNFITAFLVILVPAALAGVRDFDIGTDVTLYGIPTFNAVNNRAFSDLGYIYAQNVFSGMIEIGYFTLAYISSYFSNDPHIFLFFIAVVIGLFTYLSLYRMRKHCSIFIGELVFMFLLYPESYNMMRQCLAMAISIFALTFLLEKKYKFFIFWVLFAFLFHRTAIISFSYLAIYIYIDKKIDFDKDNAIKGKHETTTKNDIFKLASIIIAVVIVFIFFNRIISTLISLHILPVKYTKFIRRGEVMPFSLHHMFDYAFMYVFLFLNYKKIRNRNFFFALGIIDVILYLMRYRLFLMYRVSRYFMYCRVLSYSQIRVLPQKGKVAINAFMGIAIIALCILYWYEVIIIGGYNEIFPYTSQLIGIR